MNEWETLYQKTQSKTDFVGRQALKAAEDNNVETQYWNVCGVNTAPKGDKSIKATQSIESNRVIETARPTNILLMQDIRA